MPNETGHSDRQSSGDVAAPRITNPIFFIRGVEPREEIDLVKPVANAIELLDKHLLPATFLLQYDALIDERFTSLARSLDSRHNVGVWLEVVQPLAERAGLKWRGRWSWDWESHVDMLVGYAPEDRMRMLDIIMAEFRGVFGHYPESVGSWVLDAVTLGYLEDRYGVVAACVCKDQCGTDGYTLWGGYWNQAYYPSRSNALMPAQDESRQISIPVFRMLGSDPIYQYDHALGSAEQGVVSLEPVYPHAGGCREWVDWFFAVNFESPCLAFAYTQTGQENSFGWDSMATGLTYQLGQLARLREEKGVRVETLADSGKWFRQRFLLTPATAVTALTDPRGANHRSVWYNSRFYRTNLFWENDRLRIRDIHIFDQRYQERYLEETCKGPLSIYDTLPIMDGYNWSTPGELAGIRLVRLADGDCNPLIGGIPNVSETSSTELSVSWPLLTGGCLEIVCREDSLEVSLTDPSDWALDMSWSNDKLIDLVDVTDRSMSYRHEGFTYGVKCSVGQLRQREGRSVLMLPDSGRIVLDLNSAGCSGAGPGS